MILHQPMYSYNDGDNFSDYGTVNRTINLQNSDKRVGGG